MGNAFAGPEAPPVLATSDTPMYAIKKIGPRHLIVGGGGGSAKTGVANIIEQFLLSSKKTFESSPVPMGALSAAKLDTDIYATMNMDVVCISSPEQGRYLIAAGHDEYCDVYETIGSDQSTKELSFALRPVGRLTTDEKAEGAYQKCVRFDKSTQGRRLVTGGADGHVRVWNIQDLESDRNPERRRSPLVDIAAHLKEVDDVDVSPDGRFILSVGEDNKLILWDINSGKSLKDIPFPTELAKGFKVRSARFAPLGGNNIIFIVAYNTIQRTKNMSCYLALWVYNRERNACRPVFTNLVVKGESISSLCVSSCGNFTGIGMMSGSVAIFTTDDMKMAVFHKESHKSFVTGLEFLDRVATDVVLPVPNAGDLKRILPGPAASYKACLVSLSADRTIQVHTLPFESSSVSSFLLKLAVISLIFYLVIFYFSGL